jgi:hypothetical protein
METSMKIQTLLVPKISPPTLSEGKGKAPKMFSLHGASEQLTLQITTEKKDGTKEVLQIPVPPSGNPEKWDLAIPMITLVPDQSHFQVGVHRILMAETLCQYWHSANPQGWNIEKTSDKRMLTQEGLRHALGLQSDYPVLCWAKFLEEEMSQETDTEKAILAVNEIWEECHQSGKEWKKSRDGFDLEGKTTIWPLGFFQEWFTLLRSIQILEAEATDIAHLGQNYHKWSLLTNDGAVTPSKNFLIMDQLTNSESYERLVRTSVVACLKTRPSELLDFCAQVTRQLKKPLPLKKILENYLYAPQKLEGQLIPIFP